tara:strand:+ start:723 stop:1118 length:396 start_codon:yes stop_codon:yes gene_type:complete
MEENFKTEIVSPEKVIFSGNSIMTTLPAYEGDMTILKNHIPTITFLRPGIIKVKKKDKNDEDFFIQDGIVEFYNNTLVVLSSSTFNIKNLSKKFVDSLSDETREKLAEKNINDRERYILNHQLDVLKDIRV